MDAPRYWRPRTRLVPKPADGLKIMGGSAIDREIGVTHNPPIPAQDGTPYPMQDRGRWTLTDGEPEIECRDVSLQFFFNRPTAEERLKELREDATVLFASLYHTPNDRPEPWAVRWGKDRYDGQTVREFYPVPRGVPYHLIRNYPTGYEAKKPPTRRFTFRRAYRAAEVFRREHRLCRWARYFTVGLLHVVEFGDYIEQHNCITPNTPRVRSVAQEAFNEAGLAAQNYVDGLKRAPEYQGFDKSISN